MNYKTETQVMSHQNASANDYFVCICADCQKIRDESGDWKQVDLDSRWELTHGYCPECLRQRYAELEKFIKENES